MILMFGILFLEIAPDAGDRAARARGGDEVRDRALRSAPRSPGPWCRSAPRGLASIVELVGEDRVRRFVRDALRHHHVVVRMIGRHRRRRDDDFGAERLEQSHFFLRHLVGHREDALVALERRGDRQPDAGVAARAFDDRSARLEPSLTLGLLDDRPTDAVLDRSAGIEELGLARTPACECRA